MELTSQVVHAEHTLALHRRIYNAIRKRDPDEARQRMIEHLLDARDLLLRAVEKQGQSHLQERISELSPKRKRTEMA